MFSLPMWVIADKSFVRIQKCHRKRANRQWISAELEEEIDSTPIAKQICEASKWFVISEYLF